MSKYTIEAAGLVKRYKDVKALHGVDLVVSQGDILGVLGPNGAGKTTLMMILAGLRFPSSGKVRVNSIELNEKNKKSILQHIGIVFQENSLDMELTVAENLSVHAALFNIPKKDLAARVKATIDKFKLKHIQDKVIKNLSGGQRQIVEIAKSMLHEPSILLFDEPTVGLDVEVRNNIWGIIRNISKEKDKTILITSHYLEEIEELCEKVVILDKGKVIMSREISSLKSGKNKEVSIRFKQKIDKGQLEKQVGKEVAERNGVYTIFIKDSKELGKVLSVVSSYDVEKIVYGKSLEEIYLRIVGGEY